MQQYVSNGTVGSKLARANMKPANPRARPRNLETVTAARGGLAGLPCFLAFASGSFATFHEALRGDRWGSPRPWCLVRGAPLLDLYLTAPPSPCRPATESFSALIEHARLRARARTSDEVAFPSAWVSLPGDVGMTSLLLLVEMSARQ